MRLGRSATAGLSRTLAKLRAGEPLTIGVSGDSISTGLDASGKTDAQPQQPGYAQLIVAQLAALSGSDIDLVNRSVAGWSVANGVQDLAELLKSQPDLIIVAYGMNDVGRRDPRWYRERTEEILRGVREANDETEVILVSTMLGNDQWIHTPREMFPEYRDQLRELQGPTTAFADATEVWTELLEHKHFHDLTGNGLNHPNDCGHRLYAQAILRLLATRD
ncbi:MAG: SGNH/GDSL hydrolase family protein [Pirellulaceae bacterium]